ncbi:MAG: hypothetical protein HC781_08725 [Leptolyngbyaceae cyanobacterium CSU_1_4]|nr:hypothetical protein [Leptolyngbyaceae cyanobacterium CSU_1_4]
MILAPFFRSGKRVEDEGGSKIGKPSLKAKLPKAKLPKARPSSPIPQGIDREICVALKRLPKFLLR